MSCRRVKAYAAAQAVGQGAAEIDMVIQIGTAMEGRLDAIEGEIREVVRAAAGTAIKVILECCYLNDAVKRELVERAIAGGATFVKTSTGFGSGGATEDDVRLLCAAAADRIGVKAAGGIRDWPFCQRLLSLGANRIGTSAGPRIIEQWRHSVGL